jgi:hypothetical protein
MPDSDSLYHRLFSDPRMVEGLVREFAPRDVAAGLDFCRLQRVNSKFHTGRRPARRREGDVIWRLPMREGREVYLYLLIEFQSKSDHWMAVRTGVYQGLLWQQVIGEQRFQAGARVPPLLLLVLYNGDRRWKAAIETRDLIALSPDSSLWPWQPQSRYCLLDIGSFQKDELARSPSLVALLFRLEQHYSPDGLAETAGEIVDWFGQHEGCERLQALFYELICRAADRCGVKLPESGKLVEVPPMLLSGFDDWKDRIRAEARAEFAALGKAEGKIEGKAEGRAEGRAEGLAEALTSLLVRRFGAVDPSWRTRIHGAELVTLERWFDRAIDAPDLPSIFDPPR